MKVVSVRALSGYRIEVRFEDGMRGVADLSRYAGRGVFRCWNEPGEFERVHIGSSGEVEWTENVALCPDSLYLEITGGSVEDLFPGARGERLGA